MSPIAYTALIIAVAVVLFVNPLAGSKAERFVLRGGGAVAQCMISAGNGFVTKRKIESANTVFQTGRAAERAVPCRAGCKHGRPAIRRARC